MDKKPCSPYLRRPVRSLAEAERDKATKTAQPADSNAKLDTPPKKS
jgi:hypothetical protein